MFRRTVGIVLKCSPYSETSTIVTLYTRDNGKVRALAKGARRKKSEFLGILEPFSLLEIVYIESRKGLHILKEAYLIDSNFGLRERLSGIARGLVFLALIDRTQADEDPDRQVFDLLSSSLSALQHVSPENVSIVFQLQLLRHFGRLPSFTTCGRCGSLLNRTASFNPRSGDFLCRACGDNGKGSLSQGTLQALRRLSETPPQRCGRIRLLRKQYLEIAPVLGAMLRAAAEVELPAEGVADSLLT